MWGICLFKQPITVYCQSCGADVSQGGAMGDGSIYCASEPCRSKALVEAREIGAPRFTFEYLNSRQIQAAIESKRLKRWRAPETLEASC